MRGIWLLLKKNCPDAMGSWENGIARARRMSRLIREQAEMRQTFRTQSVLLRPIQLVVTSEFWRNCKKSEFPRKGFPVNFCIFDVCSRNYGIRCPHSSRDRQRGIIRVCCLDKIILVWYSSGSQENQSVEIIGIEWYKWQRRANFV